MSRAGNLFVPLFFPNQRELLALLIPHQHPYDEEEEHKLKNDLITLYVISEDITKSVEELQQSIQSLNSKLKNIPSSIKNGPHAFEQLANRLSNTRDKMESVIKETGFLGTLKNLEKTKNLFKSFSCEEWVTGWLLDKEFDVTKGEEDEELCIICSTNRPNAQIKVCNCVHPFCAKCLLSHYYENSQHLTKSFATCPTCRKEYKIDDIISTKSHFISRYTKLYTSGKVKENTRTCIVCNQKPADSEISCCNKTGEIEKCAECFLGEIWEKTIKRGERICNCKDKPFAVRIHRKFLFEGKPSMSRKKRKLT